MGVEFHLVMISSGEGTRGWLTQQQMVNNETGGSKCYGDSGLKLYKHKNE